MRSYAFPCQYSDEGIPPSKKQNAREAYVQSPEKLPKIRGSLRKPSKPLALQAMGDNIACAFDDWFLLQICFCESSRWCLRKESGFSANKTFWDESIVDHTHTRSFVLYILLHITTRCLKRST